MTTTIIRENGTGIVDGNGFLGSMVVTQFNQESGFLKGTIYGHPMRGRWDAKTKRISFIRTISVDYLQYWEGVENVNLTLTGFYQEEQNGTLQEPRYTWRATHQLQVNGNGFVGSLVIENIDANGNLSGSIYEMPFVNGVWNQTTNQISFTRRISASEQQDWIGTKDSGLSFSGTFRVVEGGNPTAATYTWKVDDPTAKKVAFVLSGGGSKGDFQLGALTALYEAGIRPDIICGTSIGALNALMLTQGESGLEDLRRIWLGLRRNDHMWLFEDWWQDIHPRMRLEILSLMLGFPTPEEAEPWSVPTGTFAGGVVGAVSGSGLLLGALVGAAASGTIQNLTADAFRDLLVILNTRARALINLTPVRNLMAERVDLAKFSQFVDSGKKLRLATVGLESGELCYVTENGDLLARDGVTKISGGIPILEAAMASASIATVFPPVNFAGDAWIDGGHREAMPVMAAIQAGATEIYAISASPVDRRSSINRTEDAIFTYLPPDQLPPTDFESRKILDIASRAMLSIHLDEMSADDIYPVLDASPLSIKVIAPEYPAHDLVTIDPELIRVNYDYGYRTAWDVLDDVSPAVRANSSVIALSQARASRLRKIAWRGIGIPFSTEITTLMNQSRSAIASRTTQGLRVTAPRGFAFSRGYDMLAGELMLPEQSITSPNGEYTLVYGLDGHLVVYQQNGANRFATVTWSTDVYGFEPGVCVMQRDGNLVVYDANLQPCWASNTAGNQDAALRLQNDGNLVIFRGNQVIWQTGYSTPTPVAGVVTIVNTSPMTLVARFYDVPDVHMGLITTLDNGILTIAPGNSATWTMPRGYQNAKVTFNGRNSSARTVIAGETVTFSTDERVKVRNTSSVPITVKIFNADALIPGGLPDAILSVPANAESYYEMPFNFQRISVLMNNRQSENAVRGSTVTYVQQDFIIVQNLSTNPREFLVYNSIDTNFGVALPGGIFTLSPNGDQRYFQVPADVQGSVQVRIRRPAFFPDLFPPILITSSVELGQTLILNPNGSVNVT